MKPHVKLNERQLAGPIKIIAAFLKPHLLQGVLFPHEGCGSICGSVGGIDSLSGNVLQTHQSSSALRSHPVEVPHRASCWFRLHFVNLTFALKVHSCK